jgi:hypothetical protein
MCEDKGQYAQHGMPVLHYNRTSDVWNSCKQQDGLCTSCRLCTAAVHA